MITRILAGIQVCIVVLIIGYGTYHLYKGNFEQTFATLPLLMGYYVFLVALKKRGQRHREGNDPSEE